MISKLSGISNLSKLLKLSVSSSVLELLMNVDDEYNGFGLDIGVDLTESKLKFGLPSSDWKFEFSDRKGTVGFGLHFT